MEKVGISSSADVQTKNIGHGSTIWQNVVILPDAKIGSDVNINAHCFVENDVVIGDRVTIKSGVYLWDGIRLDDDVFVGPNVTFTNDKFPRSKQHSSRFPITRVEAGASIGGAAVILPGITIGRGSMIGAGAVVTQSVPPFAIVYGSPARITGYVDSTCLVESDKTASKNWPDQDHDQERVDAGVKGVTLHLLKTVTDIRGNLSAGEFPRNVPFEPKRYFLVYDVPSSKTRGEHAHHKCEQFLICIKGNCSVVVDDGAERREILLDTPSHGLYLPPLTWGIQYKYSEDAVLLVFASRLYEPEDYIRDYTEFTRIVKNL